MEDGGEKYYTDFSEEEICDILNIGKKLVRENKRSMLAYKWKNKKFKSKYNMSARQIFDEFLNVEVNQFCYALEDDRNKGAHKIDLLYVFEYVFDYGEEDNIKVYLKFKIKEVDGNRILIFSFHEPEHPLKRRFV